jgi:hypothetical protein
MFVQVEVNQGEARNADPGGAVEEGETKRRSKGRQ